MSTTTHPAINPSNPRQPFTTVPAMQTLDVVRLEKKNPGANEYKQYTAMANGQGWCLFGYSRIGATWQWLDKSGGDSVGKWQSQIQSKERGGYDRVWRATIQVPQPWLEDVGTYKRQIQDQIEGAFREQGNNQWPHDCETPVANTPFGDILTEARRVVGIMAVSPDKAVAEYVALSERVDAARDELDVVNGYIETLQLMLMGGAQ